MALTTPTNTTPSPSPTPHITNQTLSPLLLLSNISNLMSIKLDYTNYIPWKHQLITILEAYSLVEHIDGSTPQPGQFLLDAQGHLSTSLISRSWNHYFKRSVEYFGAKVYFNFKGKHSYFEIGASKSQERLRFNQQFPSENQDSS